MGRTANKKNFSDEIKHETMLLNLKNFTSREITGVIRYKFGVRIAKSTVLQWINNPKQMDFKYIMTLIKKKNKEIKVLRSKIKIMEIDIKNLRGLYYFEKRKLKE